MLNLVGFTGKKRTGKDTCGGLLRSNHNFKKVHFASSLRELASKLTGVPENVFTHDKMKSEEFEKPVKLDKEFCHALIGELNLTHPKQVSDLESVVIGYEFNTWRKFLQFLGTDVIRDCISSSYWVDKGIEKIKNELELGNNVAVCDVRFENEVKAVRDLGGKVFRVVRNTNEEQDNHASEKMDYEVDGELENNDNFEELKKQLFEKVGV